MLSFIALVVFAFCGVDPAELLDGYGAVILYALAVGMGGAIISLLMSKKAARASVKARTIDGTEGDAERWLVTTVQDLANRAGLKMPEVAIYPGAANAFATGAFKNSALVAVSTDIMSQMTREELRAVLGHEISHVANGDMVTMALSQGVINTFVIFFSTVLASVISSALSSKKNENRRSMGSNMVYHVVMQACQMVLGALASIVLFWYSRRREYAADAGSAELLGTPQPMIAALRRLGNLQPGALPQSLKAFGIAGLPAQLFSTHPSLESRIQALESRVGAM